jgi:hypothetical protein
MTSWLDYFRPGGTFPEELVAKCAVCQETQCDHAAPKVAAFFCGRCGQPQCECASKRKPEPTPAHVKPIIAAESLPQLPEEEMSGEEKPAFVKGGNLSWTRCRVCHTGECDCFSNLVDREEEITATLSRETIVRNIQEMLEELGAISTYGEESRRRCIDLELLADHLLQQDALLTKCLGAGVLNQAILATHVKAIDSWIASAQTLIQSMMVFEAPPLSSLGAPDEEIAAGVAALKLKASKKADQETVPELAE